MFNVVMILVVINTTLVEAGKAWKIIIDPHNDQLSVGLIAQRVEHSIDIAEVRVRVPFRPELFGLTHYYLSSAHTCKDHTLKVHFNKQFKYRNFMCQHKVLKKTLSFKLSLIATEFWTGTKLEPQKLDNLLRVRVNQLTNKRQLWPAHSFLTQLPLVLCGRLVEVLTSRQVWKKKPKNNTSLVHYHA